MDSPENEEKLVLEAATVFLLMKKGFPISRNVRAQWILEHLETVVTVQDPDVGIGEPQDLEIVSVLPKNYPASWDIDSMYQYQYRVTKSTQVIFLAHKYRIVLCLDLSPSLGTVDIQNGEIVIDEVYLATKRFLENITKPFTVPGSNNCVIKSDIHLTVIVHTPFFTNPAQQVLVQGWLINEGNVNYLIQFIEKQLNLLEQKISLVTSMANQQLEVSRAESDQIVGGLFEEVGSSIGINGIGSIINVSMVSPEASFINMLRYGMLALSLLPEHSCANLIVITDGIVGVADIHVLDSVVQQFRATTVACSFIHLGSAYHPHCANGFVPYQDLLSFIATATLGTYIPFVSQDAPASDGEMNMYHRSFLCWQLYRTETYETLAGQNIWRTANTLFYGDQRPQLLRKKQIDDKVTCTLSSLLCCRLRDGYLIKRVGIRDGFLEICFTLPWKSHVYLEYLASTSWPSKSLAATNTIQYTITIEAPYEFLHDITCLSKKPLKSQYRQSVVSRFWATLTALTENDNMLAHFSWFPEVGWTWYNVSDTIRSGMPVFYLPTYPSTVNAIQLSEAACPQFGKIWEPIVCMEPQQWARWMHSQKITLILSHDRPLPKYLHQSNQSGRFQCVQCRQAAVVFYAMLKNWSTFVLVENHTYVQFIYREAEKPPVSFSVIRINTKALCVVLNVAFSGGTEGAVRHNVVVDLLDRISKLVLPNRPTEQNETPCCTIINKALERIIIRYERMPNDLNTVVFPDGTQPIPVRGTQIPGGILSTTLSRYLHHSRWLWNVKKPMVLTIPGITLPRLNITAIARILSTITKMRLSEGFNFAYSSAGIINMVLEVEMQGSTDDLYHPCTIQYVLFPPHVINNPTLDRVSETEVETDEGTAEGEAGNEDIEGTGDFQIVTEVWIEPQCGQAKIPSQPTAAYMHNLAYHQLTDAISLVDEECINALLTLEHLSLLSKIETSGDNSDINNGYQYQGSQYGQYGLSSGRTTRLTTVSEGILDGLPINDQRINPMFFNFDILRILPKFHQTELLYSMFVDGPKYGGEDQDDANSILMDSLLEHMKRLHNKELILSDRESQRFTDMIVTRPRDNGPPLPFSPLIDEKIRSGFRWRCFVKGVSVSHVIVTIMPASDKDVKSMISSCETKEDIILTPEKCKDQLRASTPISEIIDDESSVPGSPKKQKTSNDLRSESNLSSKTATAESTPIIERPNSAVVSGSVKSRLTLPVYVYDCSLALLIEVLVDKASSSRVKDTYEDHTFTIGEQDREELINLKSGGDVKPTISPEPKSEDSDNLSSDQRSLVEHCKLLSLAHCHCFVVAVYKSLALQLPLSYDDMEAAVEQCEEALIEINITDYLRTVCRHLSNTSENEWSSNLTSTACSDAQPLHNLIKEKFRRIITVAFEPVPAHSELYYCSPSHNPGGMLNDFFSMDHMEYQRSDSEDDLEGFTFHSETMDCKSDNPSGKANQLTTATWPVTNVIHDDTKRPRYDSSESLISELREDVNKTREQPLFLQLGCSVYVKSKLTSMPVKLVPTCVTEVSECLQDYMDCSVNDLKITLDMICLNLPKDVLEISLERGKNVRTTSYRSTSPVESARTESENSPGNETHISDGNHVRERIPQHLPLHQHNAISNLTAEIEWLLKDETATALLDVSPPTEETLKFVAKHVSESNDRPSCHKDKVPLNFVFSSRNSSPKFYEELKNLQIDRYSIQQTPSFLYLVKNQDNTDAEVDDECFKNDEDEQISKDDKSGLYLEMDDPASTSHDANSRTSKQDSSDLPGCNSEISSIGDGRPGTDDGYDGDSSNSEDDCNWLVDLDDRRPLLPNFWLILQVNNNHVDVYFHCRFLEFVSSEVDRYRQVQKMVVAQITAICRRVNQYLLLENLNDTRNCDSLLEGESHDDNTWRGESSNDAGSLTLNRTSGMTMQPGMFKCPVVWEVTFYLHPHLKTGPGRSGLSRGIKALHGVLTRFSVNNRSNMFVYRESKAKVFYLRLHEQTSNGKPLQNKLSESDERLVVSRSSSVASLSQSRGTSLRVDHARIVDTRPRVRSFGEKDSGYLNKSDNSIVLVVHGISEPGMGIRKELVQVLQNRLDDAVLEVLSVMLARNPMCKLTPADVHFIQKPYRSPENYVQLSVQPHCLSHMDALAFYLRQNILQFLYIPKYTDPRAHYHLQDYSQPEGSSLRVAENDIFLYNQSQSSGSRGIACIALAIASSNINPNGNGTRDFPGFLRIEDFDQIVSTSVYEGENRASSVPGAPIEFRIWKQGRVNLETLVEKLRGAIKHATWDLITEYNLLPTSLTVPISRADYSAEEKVEIEEENSEINTAAALDPELNSYELGEDGDLHEIYHTTLSHWFQFALDMGVSSVKKHVVKLEHRHTVATTIRELQNLVRVNAPDTSTRAFVLRSRQPFVVEEVLPPDGWLTFNSGVSTSDENNVRATVVTTDGTVQPLVYVPCDAGKETRETYVKAIVVGRNFQQWKSTFKKTMASQLLVPKDQKLLQKFNPLVQETRFIPRQRLLLAKVQNDNFTLYMYNWSKERSEKLIKQATNLGTWLSTRSTLFTNIIMQKLGIFHQPMPQSYHRDDSCSKYCQITDIDNLAKFPYASSVEGKEWSRTGNRGAGKSVSGGGSIAGVAYHYPYSWDRVTYQALRDAIPSPHYPQDIVDPVVKAAYDLQDVHNREKKSKEELARLYAMWQSRSSAPNIPISLVNLNAFKQHSRLVHYCQTPILFLPQWRLQTAATRDPSLTPVFSGSNQFQLYQQNAWTSATNSSTDDNVLAAWHQELCVSMLSEYKQYLQVLGFNPVQIDSGRQSDSKENQHCYLKKSMLGGVLFFEIHLAEPFFIAKLRIIECSRLQTKASSALVNQFMLSFVDACDKIKVNMHLHSFTYDFHLRWIHSYIAGTGQWSLQHGYHLTRFLDDFVKYYSKAPNYARNLVHSDTITVSNLSTPAHTLYSYLLSHEKTYEMQVFGMTSESFDTRDNEYVLVRSQSTSLLSYCDAQDTKHMDDFAVILIVSRMEQSSLIEKTEITLKYYLMLTSKRELYPKREVENNKLGKFRTVHNLPRSESGSQSDVYECNSTASNSYALGRKIDGTTNLTELNEADKESTDSAKFDLNSLSEDENEAANSIAPTPPPVPNSLIQNAGVPLTPEVTMSPHPMQMRQESINYLGYYSSHEQLMQQLITTQAQTAREHITDMIERGTLHCRTHLLWNKLLENKTTMSYGEFMELCLLARVESLAALDSRLNPLVNQPIGWYQGLAKVLQNKYQDHHKQFNAPDGNVTHHLILHPSYLQAFMMLTIDLQTSRGELYAVYRKSAESGMTPYNVNEVYNLVEGFVNACCFHLWIGLYSQ